MTNVRMQSSSVGKVFPHLDAAGKRRPSQPRRTNPDVGIRAIDGGARIRFGELLREIHHVLSELRMNRSFIGALLRCHAHSIGIR